MKVALVHDYLKEFGGAERVVVALHKIFPEAPLYTAYCDLNALGSQAKEFAGWDIKTSWIQNLPFAGKLISPLRLFAPKAFESFNLSGFDVVISSCAIYFAKAVKVPAKSLHISYIHTPPRYLYGFTTSFNYQKHWWTKIGGELMNHFIRMMDFTTSQMPNIIVANSENVAKRIQKFYRREPVVIYPPVEISHPELSEGSPTDVGIRSNKLRDSSSSTQNDKKSYFISVGRLVRGKGIEVIVEACSKLKLPLKVVGDGPQMAYLKGIAGPTVEFLGQVEDVGLPQLYTQAKATIVASEDEDFGIVPVEAMGYGTPVIAPRAGGFLETIVEGKTGTFYYPVSVESLMDVLKTFNVQKFKVDDCQKQAEKFSFEQFKKEILNLIKKNYKL